MIAVFSGLRLIPVGATLLLVATRMVQIDREFQFCLTSLETLVQIQSHWKSLNFGEGPSIPRNGLASTRRSSQGIAASAR
jgi:hypothetical protein